MKSEWNESELTGLVRVCEAALCVVELQVRLAQTDGVQQRAAISHLQAKAQREIAMLQHEAAQKKQSPPAQTPTPAPAKE